jgi:hypothetical protein
MKYTEVFLKRFTTGENAAQLRQMLGLSVEEVEFMLTEISGVNDVKVSVINDLDAAAATFALKITAPDCSDFDSLRFLFYGINNSSYGTTVDISPSGESNVNNLDNIVNLIFTPTI